MDRVLCEGIAEDVGMSPERLDRVRRLSAGWVEQGKTPALQVLVARRGTIVLHEAFGCLGPEVEAPPLTVGSIFGIGSMTKPITATAIMCLVEDGLLGLSRPVQEYVPEFVGEGKEAVMVHHLLTHTSGMRSEDLTAHGSAKVAAGLAAAREPLPYLRPNELVHFPDFDAVVNAPLWRAPGVEMSYCNFGYVLLAEIVARVAGRPAEQFVRERIFGPLGMVNSSFAGLPDDRRSRMVRRCPDARWAIIDHPDLISAITLGGASAYSTAHDMAAFTQMFLNGGIYGGARVLSPASVAEMTRNQIPGISAHWAGEIFPEASWGHGWGIQGSKKAVRDGSLLSPTAFSHGGASMNFTWADPAYDLVGVYLSVLPSKLPGQMIAPWRHGEWCVDLFCNAVTAAVVE